MTVVVRRLSLGCSALRTATLMSPGLLPVDTRRANSYERLHTPSLEFREMKRILWKAALATIIVFIGIVGGAYYYLEINTVKPISESWPAILRGAQIYL